MNRELLPLDERHRIHVVVREAIERWNDLAQKLHMGHRIDLAAEIVEALAKARLRL